MIKLFVNNNDNMSIKHFSPKPKYINIFFFFTLYLNIIPFQMHNTYDRTKNGMRVCSYIQ